MADGPSTETLHESSGGFIQDNGKVVVVALGAIVAALECTHAHIAHKSVLRTTVHVGEKIAKPICRKAFIYMRTSGEETLIAELRDHWHDGFLFTYGHCGTSTFE